LRSADFESSERFARARKWLEALPGVVFHNVTTRRMDEAEEDRLMDERIAKLEPEEIPPEMAGALQEMFEKQYMEWLDTPLPVLGGRTPRQTCKRASPETMSACSTFPNHSPRHRLEVRRNHFS
jgi:hypothetical protein